MADTSIDDTSWTPWIVAPGSGFEVRDPHGAVGLTQINPSQFLVTKPFRFSDTEVEQRLIDELVSDGKSAQEARTAVDDARSFTPSENPSDLASIPRYMRWFETAYGVHTLAAVLHDDLIVDEPNGGPLGSDTLSDTFFREMMGAAGVPWLKRWIMWAAVALRTRWAAGGIRRISVFVWILLSCARDHGVRLGRRFGAVRLGWPRRVAAAGRSHSCCRSPPPRCGVGSTSPASSPRPPRCGSCRQRPSPASGT